MCWCRIRMVLVGLLGLLCVVHVVSGMCGRDSADIQYSAIVSDVVLEAKVESLSADELPANDTRTSGLLNATVSIRSWKTVIRGKKLLRLKGKRVRKFVVGNLGVKSDRNKCIGSVKVNKTYIFFLDGRDDSDGLLFFKVSALPVKKSKKKLKIIKRVICRKCEKDARPPEMTAIKVNKEPVKVGKKARLTCEVSKAGPPPAFIWYRNGEPIRSKGKAVRVKSYKRKSKLVIKRVSKDDVGNYTCVATNTVGTDTRSHVLKVKASTNSGEILCDQQSYCLYGGTCYINPTTPENRFCSCPAGYTGRRCQRLDGYIYDYNRQASLLYERTLIIIGLVIAVIVLVAIFIASYVLAKRRRKRFEARRRRKETQRAKEKEYEAAQKALNKRTPFRDEERTRKGNPNQYGPVPVTDRLPYVNDNGFDFHRQQTQPLLSEHQQQPHDSPDRPGPESRRRLVASSMYDNSDQPATIWPSSVQGLTTAEVLTSPEAIEMEQLPPRSCAIDVEGAGPEQPKNSPHQPYSRPYPPLPHRDPPESPPRANGTTDHQSAPILPISRHESTPPSDHFPHPDPHLQYRNDDRMKAADPSSRTCPSHQTWPDETNMSNGQESDEGTITPVAASNPESPSESRAKNIFEPQNLEPLLSTDPRSPSPPSYKSAVRLLGHQPYAMMLSTDTDSDDDNVVYPNELNGMPEEDLHISEEDLNLSSENLVSYSFNSLSNPSRQVSVDVDGDCTHGPPAVPVSSPEHWHPRIRKHQSDDIHNGHLWNPLLPVESFRSQSLDTPRRESVLEEGDVPKKRHNHLNSTVAGSHDGLLPPNVPGGFNHVENSFDPSDDSPPWDLEASRGPDYMNMMSHEEDQINRLKDVCPDQPAIPI